MGLARGPPHYSMHFCCGTKILSECQKRLIARLGALPIAAFEILIQTMDEDIQSRL